MKIILASKSGVRKKILDKYNIENEVTVSNVDEDEVKESLLSEGADPVSISKNLAEIKSIKVSNKNPDRYVLGADSVISLNNKLLEASRLCLIKGLVVPLWVTIAIEISSVVFLIFPILANVLIA